MSVIITGGAGFVAASLIRQLLSKDEKVFALDNLCRGSHRNIEKFFDNPAFKFIEVNLDRLEDYRGVVKKITSHDHITHVWHLAANSDIPAGIQNVNVDLRDTFMSSLNTLEVMQEFNIPHILFASSSAVYGDHGDVELTENLGPLLPISNYGAMKLASEGLISAAAEKYLESALIFRFPNVVGTPATHGVILDFINKLKINPKFLKVLGNGSQQKSYLHVDDLVEAMLFIQQKSLKNLDIYNIGPIDVGVSVKQIAEEVIAHIAPKAQIQYGSGRKGWVGDVPRFSYSTTKTQKLGWLPKLGSLEAVKRAIVDIARQEGF